MARGGSSRRPSPRVCSGGRWVKPWSDPALLRSPRLLLSWYLLDGDCPERRPLGSSSPLEDGEISNGGVVSSGEFVMASNIFSSGGGVSERTVPVSRKVDQDLGPGSLLNGVLDGCNMGDDPCIITPLPAYRSGSGDCLSFPMAVDIRDNMGTENRIMPDLIDVYQQVLANRGVVHDSGDVPHQVKRSRVAPVMAAANSSSAGEVSLGGMVAPGTGYVEESSSAGEVPAGVAGGMQILAYRGGVLDSGAVFLQEVKPCAAPEMAVDKYSSAGEGSAGGVAYPGTGSVENSSMMAVGVIRTPASDLKVIETDPGVAIDGVVDVPNAVSLQMERSRAAPVMDVASFFSAGEASAGGVVSPVIGSVKDSSMRCVNCESAAITTGGDPGAGDSSSVSLAFLQQVETRCAEPEVHAAVTAGGEPGTGDSSSVSLALHQQVETRCAEPEAHSTVIAGGDSVSLVFLQQVDTRWAEPKAHAAVKAAFGDIGGEAPVHLGDAEMGDIGEIATVASSLSPACGDEAAVAAFGGGEIPVNLKSGRTTVAGVVGLEELSIINLKLRRAEATLPDVDCSMQGVYSKTHLGTGGVFNGDMGEVLGCHVPASSIFKHEGTSMKLNVRLIQFRRSWRNYSRLLLLTMLGAGMKTDTSKDLWTRPSVIPLSLCSDIGEAAVVSNIVQLDEVAVNSNLHKFESALVGRLFGRKFAFPFLR